LIGVMSSSSVTTANDSSIITYYQLYNLYWHQCIPLMLHLPFSLNVLKVLKSTVISTKCLCTLSNF
jgi:hypothetical protein